MSAQLGAERTPGGKLWASAFLRKSFVCPAKLTPWPNLKTDGSNATAGVFTRKELRGCCWFSRVLRSERNEEAPRSSPAQSELGAEDRDSDLCDS